MPDYRNDDDRTLPGGAAGINRAPETDPEHLIPEHTHAAAPGTIAAGSDPGAVRGEIERTRARMSQTIDQLEGALLRKKGQIQDRLDVAAPVRDRPWAFAGGVFGAGLLLGYLTGGRGGDDTDHVKVPRSLLEGMGLEEAASSGELETAAGRGRGARDWEQRARELTKVVARQEEEIRDLRAALYDEELGDGGLLPDEQLDGVTAAAGADVSDEWDEEWNFADERDDFTRIEAALDDEGVEEEGRGFHLTKPIAGAISAGVAAIVGGVATRLVRGRSHGGGMDVEVDLEPRHGAATDVRVDEGYRAARREMLGAELPRPASDAGTLGGTSAAPRGELEVEVELERPLPQSGRYEAPRRSGPPVSPLAGVVAAAAAAAAGGFVAKLLRDRAQHRHERDFEVELEQPQGSRPSTARQSAGGSAGTRGEMDVEVELEQSQRSRASAARQSGGARGEMDVEVELESGGTQRPTSFDAPEREYEVDLESRSGDPDRGSGSGAGGSSDVPLM